MSSIIHSSEKQKQKNTFIHMEKVSKLHSVENNRTLRSYILIEQQQIQEACIMCLQGRTYFTICNKYIV